MALVLRFENDDASTTVDLLTEARRVADSWRQDAPLDGKVTEVFRILVDEADRATVRSTVADLENILEAAFDWNADPLEYDSIWLRFATDGETAKRALVYDYDLRPISGSEMLSREMNFNTMVGFDLAVTREQYWEDVTATTASTTSLSVNGGTWDLTGTLSGGRYDGRISRLRIENNTGAIYDKLWVGLRTDRLSAGSFTASRDAYNMTVVSGVDASIIDTTGGSGPTGSTGSGVVDIDFQTEQGLTFRCYDVLGNAVSAYVGRFIVLARYRCYGGPTVGLRASVGYGVPSYSEPAQYGNLQFVDSSDWDLVELGEIQIPPSGLRGELYGDVSTGLQNIRINIEAQLADGATDGSDGIYIDELVLMPAEHYVAWDNAEFADTEYAHIYTHEDGKVQGMAIGSSVPVQVLGHATIVATDWAYPHEGAFVVVAGRRASGGHLPTDSIDVDIRVVKRWGTYHD